MTKILEFIFDFGSPNAYLVHHALPSLLRRTGAELQLTPCLLGGIFKATGNQPPMMAFGAIKGKLAYDNLEIRRFMEKHDITRFKMNPHFPVNTLNLMRGMIVAEREGYLNGYVDAGLKAMWEDGQKMDEESVFVDVMTSAGLDGAAIFAKTKDQSVKDTLMENTNKAVERGVFGIPSFFVGDEMFFGKERLGQIEEMLGA